MISICAFKETISSDENFSIFESEKGSFNYENERQLSLILSDRHLTNGQNHSSNSKKLDLSATGLKATKNEDTASERKEKFYKFSYIFLSIAAFIGIGNFSKRFC